MTRAKKSLVLSRAVYRRSYGEDRLRASLPSRFLAEVPGDLIEAAEGSQSEPGETRRYEPDLGVFGGLRTGAGAPHADDPYGRAARAAPRLRRAPSRAFEDPLIGTRVRHSKYGLGTIIEVEGDGEERKLTVSFQDYGPKEIARALRESHLA